ncbi:MAG: adenylate kinase [Aigarchaeota archaeon]|nr:adenylate kinase [Aigarchaeota archaeon]MCX8192283.1 adenylate kinase [Nitrososphaeria archaeon]MDW7986109.1 adenylate kinase [Nitrososphaerota archaeon]
MIRVIVTAVPGAGKTTILKKISEKLSSIKIVNFGDFMFEEACTKFGVVDRDDMRKKVSFRDYRILQEMAAKKIASIKEDLLIDTHASIKTVYGYYPGLPSKVVELINPDVIVFLEFRPEDILARRMKDLSKNVPEEKRMREVERVDDVEEHQKISIEMASAAANHASCYFVVLRFLEAQKYPFQHAEEAASKLIELIEKMRSLEKT